MKRKRRSVWPWFIGGIAVTGIIILFNRSRVIKKLSKVQLTKNFNLSEFVVTATGVENIPGADAIDNLRLLAVNVLQPIRDYLGWPMTITSGYRSPGVNAVVPGSSKTSQHPKGQAADFVIMFVFRKDLYSTETEAANVLLSKLSVKGFNMSNVVAVHDSKMWAWKLTNQTIIDVVRKLNLPYDQIIDEQRGKSLWVHISYVDGGGRKQWLTRRDPGPDRPREYETIKIG